MMPDQLLLPAWISFLVGMVLFFTRKWVADVARSIENLELRMHAYEKSQTECRLELARGYPTRAEMERAAERLENHSTRIAILEEQNLSA